MIHPFSFIFHGFESSFAIIELESSPQTKENWIYFEHRSEIRSVLIASERVLTYSLLLERAHHCAT